jgi:hypothetical protein
VPGRRLGVVSGTGDDLVLRVGPREIRAPLAALADAYHETIPRLMQRSATAASAPAEPVATPA